MISPYASITNFIRFQPSPPKNKQNAHKKTRRIKHRQPKPYWIYQWLRKVNQPKLHHLQINTCHQKMAKPQKTHPRATHWKTKPTFQSPCFPMWSIQPDVPSAHGAVDTLPSQQSLEFAPRYLGGDWSSCRVCSGGWWNGETCYLSTKNILPSDLRGQTK